MLSFAKQQAASANEQTPEQIALTLQLVGRNPQVEPQGAERAAGVVNDLRGNDPSQWHSRSCSTATSYSASSGPASICGCVSSRAC